MALNTLGPIEEGSLNGTVVDIMVHLIPLEVLINQVSDGLPAQDPVVGVEVGLEDCRLEKDGLIALCVQDTFNGFDYQLLLGYF